LLIPHLASPPLDAGGIDGTVEAHSTESRLRRTFHIILRFQSLFRLRRLQRPATAEHQTIYPGNIECELCPFQKTKGKRNVTVEAPDSKEAESAPQVATPGFYATQAIKSTLAYPTMAYASIWNIISGLSICLESSS
jgi:hypothetical protein